MNQVVSHNLFKQPRRWSLAGLLLFFLLTTACFGGDNTAAPEAAEGQQTGSLACTETCRTQGQCGTAADGRIVILAHSGGPATRDHNTVINNESAVTILSQEQRTIQETSGTQSTMTFFNVQPANSPAAWVIGSCVNLATP